MSADGGVRRCARQWHLDMGRRVSPYKDSFPLIVPHEDVFICSLLARRHTHCRLHLGSHSRRRGLAAISVDSLLQSWMYFWIHDSSFHDIASGMLPAAAPAYAACRTPENPEAVNPTGGLISLSTEKSGSSRVATLISSSQVHRCSSIEGGYVF